MEPLLPSDPDGHLAELALRVVRDSASLSSLIAPATRPAAANLLQQMNSYYSNQIEGHYTHPRDIERALRGDYSAEPARRALQLESRAHVEVQRLMEQRLDAEPDLNICSSGFLRWLHREFYARMPAEFLVVQDRQGRRYAIEPGEIRQRAVTVGAHIPPAAEHVSEVLERFAAFYQPASFSGLPRIVAACASHHRLAWIHPFLDGNGRVTRLFTQAYLIRAEVAAHNLWTLSRGLSRRRDRYLSALAAADRPRAGDLDGRGNLSDRGLRSFCQFFLETALDQIEFMGSLLELPKLTQRVTAYAELRATLGELPTLAASILREALLRGEVPRGEMTRITGKPERSARRILEQLLKEELLVSATPKGPVRLHFPAKVAPYYFPRLYPGEMDLLPHPLQ
jgi:Fic family protein